MGRGNFPRQGSSYGRPSNPGRIMHGPWQRVKHDTLKTWRLLSPKGERAGRCHIVGRLTPTVSRSAY
jgi:hypothetical protein